MPRHPLRTAFANWFTLQKFQFEWDLKTATHTFWSVSLHYWDNRDSTCYFHILPVTFVTHSIFILFTQLLLINNFVFSSFSLFTLWLLRMKFCYITFGIDVICHTALLSVSCAIYVLTNSSLFRGCRSFYCYPRKGKIKVSSSLCRDIFGIT